MFLNKKSFLFLLTCVGIATTSLLQGMGNVEPLEIEKEWLKSEGFQKGKETIILTGKTLDQVKEDIATKGVMKAPLTVITVTYYIVTNEKYIDAKELFDKFEEKCNKIGNIMEIESNKYISRNRLQQVEKRLRHFYSKLAEHYKI
jgi:hypothetical protein